MKTVLFNSDGTKKSQIDLPKIFETKIREDIVAKYFEAEKISQPYSIKDRAGLRHAAFGKISHKRHDWKGQYGRGMSRIPRKTMYRHGTQFYWVGANMPGTRGGRRAHPPIGIGKEKKLNKKEIKIAFNSAYAATANFDFIKSRYLSIQKIDSAPIIIESLPNKTKELSNSLKNIFANNYELVFKNKVVRAGVGKRRNRKYKSNAGALIVVAKDENKRFKGIEIKSIDELKIADFCPLGRLTIYTKKALDELAKETREENKK